tara:strand:- start:280 stop:636 length:357 start_codon:yes stop_codon:yes gene_type:complete
MASRHAQWHRERSARKFSATTATTLATHIYDLYGKNSRHQYITLELLLQLWDEHVQKHGWCCCVTGQAFDMTQVDLRPSIDQISPGSGYWPWNIRFTTFQYNQMRGTMSILRELQLLA